MKDRIIKKSIELFNEFGCKFSMEALSKALSISKKTLYKYFSSKEELISYIINESFNEVHEKQNSIYQSDLSLEMKLREILTTNFAREDSIKMENTKDIKLYYPTLALKIEDRYREEWTLVKNLLIEGRNLGLFDYWSLSYLIEIMQEAMSLVILHLDGTISYQKAIDITMNSIVDIIKRKK